MRLDFVSTGRRTLALVLVLTLCLVAMPAGVAVASADEVITVEQGEDCHEIDPFGSGDRTVEEFYDYDVSHNYSSKGTTHLQDNQVSNLLVYNGSEGYSLVLVHDEYGDTPYGGVASMTFTGLPADGEWAVEDDGYADRDDSFDHQGTRSEIDWMWYDGRTDGGAFRGLTASETVSITVDPAFNEEAAAWGEWNASGNENDRIEEWRLYTGPDETTTLDMDRSVTVTNTGCDGPPSAALAAQPATATVGESVTLNASDATDDEGIAGYGWDFDGDGTVDLNTTTPTAAYTYDSTGEYEATVTVRDYANNTDTATTTVTITEDSSDGDGGDGDESDGGSGDGDGSDGDGDTDDGDDGDVPVPALTGPTETTVGEPVTLDASASTDGDGIQSYGWNFDGDTTIERTTLEPTAETSFDEPGTYTVVVTVRDENGNEATAEHAIEVAAADAGPTGEIDAPAEATVGDPVTIEATALSDGITHVCWYFDGAAGPEGQSVQHTFEEPGTHGITLQLRDDRGRETTVSTEIDVVADDSGDGDSGDGSEDGSDDSEDGDSDDGNAGDGSEDDSEDGSDDNDGNDGSDDGDSSDGDDSDENDGSDDSDDGDGSDETDDSDDSDETDDTDDGNENDGSDDSDENDGSDDSDGADGDDGSGGAGVGDLSLDPDVPTPLDRIDSGNSTNGTATDPAVSVADVRTSRETVDAGSRVEITVAFDETGDGTAQVPLTVHRRRTNGTDAAVDELSVTVPGNGTETASVATTLERPGEYLATVDNRTAAFSVLAAASDDGDGTPATEGGAAAEPADDPGDATDAEDTTTSANGPGFGPLAAALGLVMAGLLAVRRRSR